MQVGGYIPVMQEHVNPLALAARARSNRQKLLVTLAATCLCAALVALLGDDSGYRELEEAREEGSGDDDTASTAGQLLHIL